MTCDFQQCGILTSEDSDDPVHLPLSLDTPDTVQSVALGSNNIQATTCNTCGCDKETRTVMYRTNIFEP